MQTIKSISLSNGSVLLAILSFALHSGNLFASSTQGKAQFTVQLPMTEQRPELALGRHLLYDYDPPEPGTYALPVLKPAGDGQVLGKTGQLQRLRELFKDHITVVSFIYTRCNDPMACPHATGVLYQLHQISQQDPALAMNLHLVTFSFDPDHDTPEVMASFERRYQRAEDGARWTFLTTRSPEDLKPILAAYGQTVDQKKNPDDDYGPFFHQVRVYLIDRQGMVRNIYSYGLLDPRLLMTDVRTLLLEETASEQVNRTLSPAQALQHTGKICTVAFKVRTTALVTDITEPGKERPVEVLLLDAANGDFATTPTERASLLASIPASALGRFNAASLDELAGRFEGKTVAVTGKVQVEPYSHRNDSVGPQTPTVRIVIAEPNQIQVKTGNNKIKFK